MVDANTVEALCRFLRVVVAEVPKWIIHPNPNIMSWSLHTATEVAGEWGRSYHIYNIRLSTFCRQAKQVSSSL
jgi:hypothetical protein